MRHTDRHGKINENPRNLKAYASSEHENILNLTDLTTQSTLIPRDDCSYIKLQCPPADYSASILTHACEDAGATVVDLLTSPADARTILVTMRLRCDDPSPAVHNLERYGYDIVEAEGNNYTDAAIAEERLLELQTLLNV